MARKPDLPCAGCGKLLWRGSKSRPEGVARCRPCRRDEVQHGDDAMYKKRGCRCDSCRAGQARRMREYTARRKAEGRPINFEAYRARVERACEHCSVLFGARLDSPGRFCSLTCTNLFQGGGDRPRREDRFRIAKSRRIAIYTRDKWVCQVCLEPVDCDADSLSDWFPSLDHIVPRSHGGSDEDSNLRTLHRWCNSVRGNLSHYTDEDFQVLV